MPQETFADIVYAPFDFPIEAFSGSTWAFPFIGIYFFLTSPRLWRPVYRIILPQIVISTLVFIVFHIYFYPPQALVATFFNGPTGLITAWIVVLQQAGITSRFIIEKTILPGPLKQIFDTVLRTNATPRLLRQIHSLNTKELDFEAANSKKSFSELVQERAVAAYDEWMVYLSNPYYWLKFTIIVVFNLIPFFGPYILIFLRSPGKARGLHSRYYLIRGFSNEEKQVFFNAHRALYTAFGIVALNLELIPVVGMFFTFTNIVAAALWAGQLDKVEVVEPL